MSKVIKLKLEDHLRNLRGIFSAALIGVMLCIIIYFIDYDKMIFSILGIAILLSLVPVILIHLNYYRIDKKRTITIDSNKKTFRIASLKENIEFDQKEIQNIELTQGLQKAGSSPWSSYYYFKIELENGTEIFLTSLLMRLKEFPYQINNSRRTAFPFIKNNKVE